MQRWAIRVGSAAAILSLLLLTAFGATGCSSPRSSKQPPGIAVLIADDIRQAKVDGLRDGLAAAGFRDGADVRLSVVSTHGSRDGLDQAAEELLDTEPAVVVAAGNIEALRLKAAISRRSGATPPLVVMGAASTVESGLVNSLRTPGYDITGLDNGHAELTAKRLELLLTLLPGAKRVIAIHDPSVAPGRHSLSIAMAASERLNVSLIPLSIETPAELSEKLAALKPGDADAILLLSTSLLESAGPELYQTSLRTGIPTMGVNENDVEAGNFAAYGVSYEAQGRQTARFVVKILQGQRPANLPVETPDSPELVVNLDLAKRLGLRLSPVGLAFARVLHGPDMNGPDANPGTLPPQTSDGEVRQ